MNRQKLKNFRKFTLMELLIVIAIIGILLTLLLPSLQKARESAKTAVCLSQLKQVGISYFQYSTESNSKALQRQLRANKFWMAKLYAYHKNRDLLKCPSATHDSPSVNGVSTDGSYWGSAKQGWVGGEGTWMMVDGKPASGSYGFNFRLYYNTNDGGLKTMHDIMEPANTPLFTGSIWPDHNIRHNTSNPLQLEGGRNFTERVLLDRHYSKKNNSLQVDGSAKTYHLRNTLQFEWYENFRHRSLVIP